MSMVRMFTMRCDRCLGGDDWSGWWADEVRRQAKQDGWKRVKGQDVCPRCVAGEVSA